MATQLKQDEPQDEPNTDPPANDDQRGEPQERDFDAEARSHGWVPADEFKGDPAKWVDAETYARRADEVMPLIKKQNKELKRKLEQLEKTNRQFAKFAAGAEARLRAEIEAEMADAVEKGDKTRVDQLRKQEKELGAATGAPQHSREEAEQAFDDFREENAWYDLGALAGATDDQKSARAYADRMTERHMAKTKEMAPAEFFTFIGGLVKERFPTLSARPVRVKPQSDVAPAGSGRPRGDGKTWEALPPEARQRFEKWIGQGMGDKAYYVKTFDWDGWKKEAAR